MVYNLGELSPKINQEVFIAPSADVIGDVTLGFGSSIWFQTVLRGDVYPITVGDYSNIQDGCVIHVTSGKYKTIIKNHVTIGHGAVIHGATLEDYSFIGMSTTVMDRAVVSSYSMVAAGALVPPGFIVPEKTLVAGVPAKVIRELKPEEITMIEKSSKNYYNLSKRYSQNLAKDKPIT